MIEVHAKGTWGIVSTKTGKPLVRRLRIDRKYQIDAPMNIEIVRRAVAEADLRSMMVAEFHQMLKSDRALYLKIGRTQWSVEPDKITYQYEEQE
jgi:hypothetical protein